MTQHFHWCVAESRRTSSKQVVKNRAEAVDIGCGSHSARIGRLFRRHVVWRAKDRKRLSQIALASQPFRETEIAYVWLARGVEENVRRL